VNDHLLRTLSPPNLADENKDLNTIQFLPTVTHPVTSTENEILKHKPFISNRDSKLLASEVENVKKQLSRMSMGSSIKYVRRENSGDEDDLIVLRVCTRDNRCRIVTASKHKEDTYSLSKQDFISTKAASKGDFMETDIRDRLRYDKKHKVKNKLKMVKDDSHNTNEEFSDKNPGSFRKQNLIRKYDSSKNIIRKISQKSENRNLETNEILKLEENKNVKEVDLTKINKPSSKEDLKLTTITDNIFNRQTTNSKSLTSDQTTEDMSYVVKTTIRPRQFKTKSSSISIESESAVKSTHKPKTTPPSYEAHLVKAAPLIRDATSVKAAPLVSTAVGSHGSNSINYPRNLTRAHRLPHHTSPLGGEYY